MRVTPTSRAREETEGHEANLPAQPNTPSAQARISFPDENGTGPQRDQTATGEGPEAARAHDTLEVTVATGTGRFRRSDRLRHTRDYGRVSAQGTRLASREFVMLIAAEEAHPGDRIRLGITASRKVGNAVVRNRVKRAVRDWFRTRRAGMAFGPGGADLVVIARRAAAGLDPAGIADRLDSLIGRSARGRV